MIARGFISLGLMWLLAPHEPDLGIARSSLCPTAILCQAMPEMFDDAMRARILKRLVEVKYEIRDAQHPSTVSVVGARGAMVEAVRHLSDRPTHGEFQAGAVRIEDAGR